MLNMVDCMNLRESVYNGNNVISKNEISLRWNFIVLQQLNSGSCSNRTSSWHWCMYTAMQIMKGDTSNRITIEHITFFCSLLFLFFSISSYVTEFWYSALYLRVHWKFDLNSQHSFMLEKWQFVYVMLFLSAFHSLYLSILSHSTFSIKEANWLKLTEP